MDSTNDNGIVNWLNITTAMAVVGLVAIIDRFGEDHTATNPNGTGGCVYAVKSDGVLVPVCVVGQFFADLGLLGMLLTDPSDPYSGALCEGNPGNLSGIGSAKHRLAERGVTMDDGAHRIFSEAQGKQDSGWTWKDAIVYAIQQAESYTDLTLPESPTLDRARLVRLTD